jgi:predicted nucleic-acid-binding protein
MRAVDTNVVVRLLTADDVDQFARLKALFDAHEVFIPTTVVLETEWVLRKAYGLTTPVIMEALGGLAGTSNVHVQDPLLLSRALEAVAGGLDFADALHLAASVGCADFVSFDRPLARRAARLGTLPVVEP